jgi:hypothetical protein
MGVLEYGEKVGHSITPPLHHSTSVWPQIDANPGFRNRARLNVGKMMLTNGMAAEG